MTRPPIFITATDTHVGKTMACAVLGMLYRAQGYDVGVMKPVQCAGHDAAFLKRSLALMDDMALINPCFAPEPLSPHLAFRRAGTKVSIPKIRAAFKILSSRHDVMLVEGAGGIMVPLTDSYFTVDLIKELKAEVIIVARLGLGTINHTLLTINHAQSHGLRIKGIMFSAARPGRRTLPEKTNPTEIARLSGCRVLGTVPFLGTLTPERVLKVCRGITID